VLPTQEPESARYEREAPETLKKIEGLLTGVQPDAEQAILLVAELEAKLPPQSQHRARLPDLKYRAYIGDGERRLAVGIVNLDLPILGQARERFAKALEQRPGDAAAAGMANVELAEWRVQYEKAYEPNNLAARADERIGLLTRIHEKRPDYDGAQWSVREKLYAELITRAERRHSARDLVGARSSLDEAQRVKPDGTEGPQLRAKWFPTPTVPSIAAPKPQSKPQSQP
jgi:hypothetical protein